MAEPEELESQFWICWTWKQYYQLEWWQRCAWAPREVQ